MLVSTRQIEGHDMNMNEQHPATGQPEMMEILHEAINTLWQISITQPIKRLLAQIVEFLGAIQKRKRSMMVKDEHEQQYTQSY